MILSKYKLFTSIFVALGAMYIGLTVLLPPDKAILMKYKITDQRLVVLALTVAIPYLIIWFIALIGYLRLKSYAKAIEGSKDGAAFTIMSRGVMLLTLWLPLSTILGAITTWYARVHPASAVLMASLSNYFTLLLLFAAFLTINRSSGKLLAIIKKPVPALPQLHMIAYIALTTLYVFMVLHDPVRQFPNHDVRMATYYLPDWLTITTIVIPRLISWYLGIQAVYNIYLYRKKIKGPIYKQALDNLAKGVAWVVLTVIVLRCYQSLSSQLSHLSLGLILLVVYAILILISVGYILIAKGAKSLQLIEEV